MTEQIIAPSILSANFNHLGDQIKACVEGGAKYIHFDVMDGQFVPNISFGIPVLKSVRKETDAVLDVHLMIVEPERYVEQFAEAGADIITFHVEATEDIEGCIKKIKACGKQAGLVIKPDTPVDKLFPYLPMLKMVLIMSVEPGFGGQSFMESALPKISKIANVAKNRGLRLDIEVDGGINEETILKALDAGANVFVAGSSVFKGDATENTKNLAEIVKKRAMYNMLHGAKAYDYCGRG